MSESVEPADGLRPPDAQESGELQALAQRRRLIFNDVGPQAILCDADGLLVTNKPAGVPSQATEPDAQDSWPQRLGSFLEARGQSPYLGIHQRLDRDTSGVVAYARNEEANRYLAGQLEGRRAIKTYVAAVEGWTGGGRTLRHRLAKGSRGMEVVGPGHPKGREAISHVEVMARKGGRALLRVVIATGRTHQIRVQLAATGAQVAGDLLYGGSPAPRLMLHAAELTMDDGRSVAAPLPAVFDRWLQGDDLQWWTHPSSIEEILKMACERRWGLARAVEASPSPTSAFRLVNGEGDGLSGVSVDVYGDHLVASFHDVAAAHEDVVLDALHGLGFAGVYVKRRPKQANVVGDSRSDDQVAPALPLRGEAAPTTLVAWEQGLRFPVSLGDGLSTGLFLDMREPRRLVRQVAAGRSVLNLFAYTGSFSLAASAGGARDVFTVDVAAPALERAEEAFTLNGLSRHRTLRADCFLFLEKAIARGERYDLILCDPPTYATTKKSRWTSGKGWIVLAEHCLRVAAPGALLMLSSNDARMSSAAFRRYLTEGAARAGIKLRGIRLLPHPADFPITAGSHHPCKRFWLEL